MKERALRFGLIGCGEMAGHHARVLMRLGVELSAVCGRPGSARAGKFARQFRIPKAVSSWEDLVADRNVDALWVATPWDVTDELLPQWVGSLKPIFVEKPAGLSSAAIERSIRIQRETGNPVAVGMNRRFYDFVPELQEILKTQSPRSISVILPEQPSRHSPPPSNLKNLWFISSLHEIDFLLYLLGEIRVLVNHFPETRQDGALPVFHSLLETTRDRVPIHLIAPWGTPWNKSIHFFFEDFVVELNPIERMRIFRGVERHPPSWQFQIARFQPLLEKERWTSLRYKPGLQVQDSAVVAGLASGSLDGRVATLDDAWRATRLMESLLERPASGPGISSKAIERIPHDPRTRQGFEAMDRNERTVDFPPQVMEEIRRLVTPFTLRAYPEPEVFYRQLARWLGVPREMLLLSWGADGAFQMIYEVFVKPGNEVVHAVPSYGMFPIYCEMKGGVSKPVPFREDLSLPLEEILGAITPHTRLVILANPNQPIERVYTPAECRQLLDRCKQHGALLVMDEAYHHFCDLTALPLLKDYENLVVVRTFSKAFGMAGLRLGFLVGARETVQRIERFRPMYEAHSVALAVGGYLLKNDHLMKEYVSQVKESRRFLVEALRDLQILAFGQWGNSVLAALPREISAPELAEELKRKGFLVRAETAPPLRNHLRITVGTPEQTKRFFSVFEPIVRPELVEGRTAHGRPSSP